MNRAGPHERRRPGVLPVLWHGSTSNQSLHSVWFTHAQKGTKFLCVQVKNTITTALGRHNVLPRRIPVWTSETDTPLKSINQTCKHVEGAFAYVRSWRKGVREIVETVLGFMKSVLKAFECLLNDLKMASVVWVTNCGSLYRYVLLMANLVPPSSGGMTQYDRMTDCFTHRTESYSHNPQY